MQLSTSFMEDLAAKPPATNARRFAVRIGEVSLGISSASAEMILVPDSGLHEFLVPDARCEMEFDAAWSEGFGPPPGELVFESGGLWQLFQDGEGYCFRFATAYLGAQPYKQARVSRDFHGGRVELLREYFPSDCGVNPLEYPLDELLWIHRLSQGSGVELHGCGVITPEGRGLLLSGHSGAGKSTSARLWAGMNDARVLSDDRIILRREPSGRFTMYGTPWHGDAGVAEAASWPLDAIFILSHAPRNRMRPMGMAPAAAELFARSFVPHHSADSLSFLLNFFAELTRSVPCSQFEFVPDFSAVEALLREAF